MIVNSCAGPKINENLTKRNVKKNAPKGVLCSLHLIGEGSLAVVNLDNLIIPVMEQTILNLVGSETDRQAVLARGENLLDGQRGIRDSGEYDGLCLIVGKHLRVDLLGGLLILCADVLNRSRQVDGGVVLHEIGVQSGDGVLLHSNCLSGLWSFLLLLYIHYSTLCL